MFCQGRRGERDMTDNIYIVASLAAGMVLGALYFSGLWYTVRHLPDSKRPFMSLFGSFAVRAGIVLGGFYFVAGGHWERFIAVLIGFILMREILIRRIGRGHIAHAGEVRNGSRCH
jgi:F1F0 ATPase subunit 2